jgi:hypothetical protein
MGRRVLSYPDVNYIHDANYSPLGAREARERRVGSASVQKREV